MSISASKIISQEPLSTQDAKWVKLVKTTYTDPNGTERTWESSERCTRPPGIDFDGVGIIAILELPGFEPTILLQKQYRPPIGKVTVEIPAGLIDANETPEECAIRELYEETGYHGVVVPVGDAGERSCLMFNDPGMCNTNLHFVHVKIDLTDPRNENPKQQLEENEFIECFMVPLKSLYKECRRLEAEGLAIDARVGSLAEGFEVARRWKFL
ncbi:NUDIX hydrolase domain-like protein [Morchella snyderi]|nr:NUDIX hydrolase domain-like protein [Morchella snyderi]